MIRVCLKVQIWWQIRYRHVFFSSVCASYALNTNIDPEFFFLSIMQYTIWIYSASCWTINCILLVTQFCAIFAPNFCLCYFIRFPQLLSECNFGWIFVVLLHVTLNIRSRENSDASKKFFHLFSCAFNIFSFVPLNVMFFFDNHYIVLFPSFFCFKLF